MNTEETIAWLRDRKPVCYADDIANKLEWLLKNNAFLKDQLERRERAMSQIESIMKIHWRTK